MIYFNKLMKGASAIWQGRRAMKESFEYYDEETGLFIWIPGDDFREFWDSLLQESEVSDDLEER